jgi:nitrite reductase (NADH) small subunit
MNQATAHSKQWIRVTQAENIPLREGRAITIAGHNVAIFNLGDRFLAVENKCPHRGGPLADGIVSGRTVVCPLHAWKVDLESDQVTNRPGENPCVKTFPAVVRDGVVMIELAVFDSQRIAPSPACMATTGPSHSAMSAHD